MHDKVLFRLVEKTAGPWHGKVWRYEEMTQAQADAVNSRITVMKWERADAPAAGAESPVKRRGRR